MATKDYDSLYQAVFGVLPARSPNWINFPFEWGSSEAYELQEVIWRIESKMWRRFLESLKEEGVKGCIVEFGVSGGNSLGQLLEYCEDLQLGVDVYGFDSFEGLPRPGQYDPPYWQEGDFEADYASVASRLKLHERSFLHLVRGWFDETLTRPEIHTKISSVVLARVDCDLYQSALTCLNFLTGRLANGAYLCFDDWYDDPSRGETRAFFEWFERVRHIYRLEPALRISLGGMHVRVWHR